MDTGPLKPTGDNASAAGDGQPAGLTMSSVLDLPEDERTLVTWLTRRREASLAEVVAQLGCEEDIARATLLALQQRGLVQEIPSADGQPKYRPRTGRATPRRSMTDIWSKLDKPSG